MSKIIFIKIALLGSLFELASCLRILLVLKQNEWKQTDPWKYNVVFIAYILVGEFACQIVLIYGVIAYTHKLRVKYLRQRSPTNSPQTEHFATSSTYNRIQALSTEQFETTTT